MVFSHKGRGCGESKGDWEEKSEIEILNAAKFCMCRF